MPHTPRSMVLLCGFLAVMLAAAVAIHNGLPVLVVVVVPAAIATFLGYRCMPVRPHYPRLQRLSHAIALLGVVNFLSFWVVGAAIGGDAVTGKAEGGRYFLRTNGRYTEVSQRTREYSRVHTISNFITFPLMMISGGLAAGADTRARAARG